MKRSIRICCALVPVTVAAVAGASPALAAGGSDTPFFNNCSEARAAGKTDIPETSPSYRKVLDRDGDGTACETNEGSSGSTSGSTSGGGGGSTSSGSSGTVRINTGTGGGADRDSSALPAAVGGLGALVLGSSVVVLRRRASAQSRG
jgi:hypothetical protein